VSIHLLTPEYPPSTGGVADYTRQIARALTVEGETVHVWCPPHAAKHADERVEVHMTLGQFRRSDLRETGRLLDECETPRRLLVQWVPHGFGFRSMNIGFCLWLWARARRGDDVELVVHEPYLAFREGTWRQNAAAVVHRGMTVVLLRAARRVWVTIPAWEAMWKPYALGRDVPFTWLPIPSSLDLPDSAAVKAVRARHAAGSLIGHLGTYGTLVASLLSDALDELLIEVPGVQVVLMGSGSEGFRKEFVVRHPKHAERVAATGALSSSALAAHVAACDVLVQPYPDGISSRRTSAMAGLHLGVPIVTTMGRLTEPFWETSGAVRLCRVGDWAALAGHVEQLTHEPDERRRMIQKAHDLYDRLFDVRRTVTALRSAA
jgi:glycosyltransferase involved in cell wall biosynthesis